MHHRKREQTEAGRTWARAAGALGTIGLVMVLSMAAMGCELLDNLGAGTGAGAGTGSRGGAVLLATTAILEEARRIGRSPTEVLQRRYELERDALNTRYEKEIKIIESKRNSGAITAAEAEPKIKLLELEQAKEVAELEAMREQRETEIDELKDLLGTQ